MKPMTSVVAIAAFAVLVPVGCSTAPSSPESRERLLRSSAETLREWDRLVPGVQAVAAKGYGYALFPEITKAGLGFGGAYGKGVVYEQGQHIGYADLTQATVGFQLGGQTYSELIVFENQAGFEHFKRNPLAFSADATAVILRTGTAANAQFIDGVAVLVKPTAGAMAEAAVGGQQLTFVPK